MVNARLVFTTAHPLLRLAEWCFWGLTSKSVERSEDLMSETVHVDYSTKIPNNVGLQDDQRVLKALEQWHPGYIDWWMTMGPEGFQTSDVYLRTAISIDPKGWAKFDYVKMPDYRWGILLAPRQEDRQVNFGTHKGEKAWQEVP